MTRVQRVRLRGEVQSRGDADDHLAAPGDMVLVRRGPLRSVVMACPDGCGSVLTVNLDPRAGKAWRVYSDRRGFSLYPSVWREGGCQSHFIVWRDRILWCDRYVEEEEPDHGRALEDALFPLLSPNWASAESLAHRLDEIPWEVARAGRSLARRGLAEAGIGDMSDHFRGLGQRVPPTPPGLKVKPIRRGIWQRLADWFAGRN
jgi:hypothetical protein